MKRFLTVLIGLVAFVGVKSQPLIGLSLPTPVANFNKLVSITDSAHYWVTVENKGNQNFSGTIVMQTEIDTGAGLNVFQTDSFTVPGVLAPNDTISFPLMWFAYGTPGITTQSQGNIVVIWPINGVDSFVDTFWVQVGTGYLDNPVAFDEVNVFPVPASQSVNVRSNNPDIYIERVRIFDMTGKLVTDEQGTGVIPLHRHPAGRYILEVELKNGQKGRYDVIKN